MNHDIRETGFYDCLECLVIRLDRQGNIWFMNRFGLKRLGYQRLGQIFGKPLATVLPSPDVRSSELLEAIVSLGQGRAPPSLESDLLHADGSLVPMLWALSYQRDDSEVVAPTILIGFDAAPVRSCQTSVAMFQTVSDNYAGSIVITAPDKTILYANPAVLLMTGYSSAEVLGQTPALFKSGQTSDEVYRSLWETLNAGGIWTGELINRRKDGSQYLESKTISAIRNARGQVEFYFAIGEDLSQRQKYQQNIETLLSSDVLTGLPNRSAFLSALVVALDSARHGAKEVTVLHIDLDDFFAVNDAQGVDQADLLIAEMAQRIKGSLRQADRLARLGNDKFAILMGPHESGIDQDIDEVIERVMTSIRGPVVQTGAAIYVTASIGISAYPKDGDSAGELLSHAMNATEQAKTDGGNRSCRFDAMHASNASVRREILSDLHRAIECGELVLHFQPQVNLFSGAMTGLEALIRWQHPQRGLVFPVEFIFLAEQSQIIMDLGEWVLREACRQMRAWLDSGLAPIKVAINLSARHFIAPNLSATIADALAVQGIEPRFLEIEITEGAMMQDVAAAIRSTKELKAVGVRISLDDFGTGYSSLAYLSRFPIDVVKIDQSFICDITTNPVNAAIAQATIAMSHKLGKVVLAEGVETEEQMQYLRRNECDEMQGYFFSKPLPADELARLLETGLGMSLSGHQGSEGGGTVLFVDDEANILASLKRTLRREGYEILTAENAAEGFSLLARNSVQVVVSDQRMPEMNGTEFLSRVKALYPQTVRMVLSGYSEISAVTDSINKGAVYRFMLKPWNDEQLKIEVSGALRYWRELYGADTESS
ncbi:MAG: EAL domain-containing protein [Betaproteobacteria bacterium]